MLLLLLLLFLIYLYIYLFFCCCWPFNTKRWLVAHLCILYLLAWLWELLIGCWMIEKWKAPVVVKILCSPLWIIHRWGIVLLDEKIAMFVWDWMRITWCSLGDREHSVHSHSRFTFPDSELIDGHAPFLTCILSPLSPEYCLHILLLVESLPP